MLGGEWENDGFYDRQDVSRLGILSRRRPIMAVHGIAFVILLLMSAGSETWTLNAGESRRIVPGFLSQSIEVAKRSNDKDLNVAASLYAIPDNKCPPLTGPKVSLSDVNTMTLGRDDYQYDYFYLNDGSTLTAKVSQTLGSSEVLLLRGRRGSMDLEAGHVSNNDWDDMRRDSLSSFFIKANGNKQITHESKHSDTYTLVYDNASSSKAELRVSYTLQLTTFNLDDYSDTLACTDLTYGCPPIEKKSAGCIILATYPNSEGGGEITLTVTTSRNWLLIVLLSTIPAWLMAAREVLRSRKEQQGWHQVGGNDDDGVEVIQCETIRIPPAGGTPQPAPSVPTEASIPMAQAEVVCEDAIASDLSTAPIDIPIEQIEPVTVSKK